MQFNSSIYERRDQAFNLEGQNYTSMGCCENAVRAAPAALGAADLWISDEPVDPWSSAEFVDVWVVSVFAACLCRA